MVEGAQNAATLNGYANATPLNGANVNIPGSAVGQSTNTQTLRQLASIVDVLRQLVRVLDLLGRVQGGGVSQPTNATSVTTASLDNRLVAIDNALQQLLNGVAGSVGGNTGATPSGNAGQTQPAGSGQTGTPGSATPPAGSGQDGTPGSATPPAGSGQDGTPGSATPPAGSGQTGTPGSATPGNPTPPPPAGGTDNVSTPPTVIVGPSLSAVALPDGLRGISDSTGQTIGVADNVGSSITVDFDDAGNIRGLTTERRDGVGTDGDGNVTGFGTRRTTIDINNGPIARLASSSVGPLPVEPEPRNQIAQFVGDRIKPVILNDVLVGFRDASIDEVGRGNELRFQFDANGDLIGYQIFNFTPLPPIGQPLGPTQPTLLGFQDYDLDGNLLAQALAGNSAPPPANALPVDDPEGVSTILPVDDPEGVSTILPVDDPEGVSTILPIDDPEDVFTILPVDGPDVAPPPPPAAVGPSVSVVALPDGLRGIGDGAGQTIGVADNVGGSITVNFDESGNIQGLTTTRRDGVGTDGDGNVTGFGSRRTAIDINDGPVSASSSLSVGPLPVEPEPTGELAQFVGNRIRPLIENGVLVGFRDANIDELGRGNQLRFEFDANGDLTGYQIANFAPFPPFLPDQPASDGPTEPSLLGFQIFDLDGNLIARALA